METPSRSIALDLLATDLDDLESPHRVHEIRRELHELAEAQTMVRQVLDAPRPAEPPLLNREQIGLRHVDEAAAGPLDAILRADVHQRAVWFSRVDILIPITGTVTDAAACAAGLFACGATPAGPRSSEVSWRT